MIERRYQIFISSTFRDLIAERQAVLLAVQKLNHIPAGMELFPSANEAPWELIARIVEASDYYVLIVGGRYGSTDEEGVSFTEREHQLAMDKEIPVLAFLHRDPSQLAFANSEANPEARKHLEAFRAKVEGLHHCVYWKSADDLATAVIVGLVNEIAKNPRTGWVRGFLADETQELLTAIESVRRENDAFREANQQLTERIAESYANNEFSQGQDAVTLTLHRRVEEGKTARTESSQFNTTWHDLFMAMAWEARSGATEAVLRRSMASEFGKGIYMDDETWRKIATQFIAIDLIAVRQEMRVVRTLNALLSRPERSNGVREEPIDIWYLTPKGRRLYAEANAVKR